jgi:hypothetical protein
MTGDIGLAETHDVGINAYIYLYPLVTIDLTRQVATNIEPGRRPGFGPMNTFSDRRAGGRLGRGRRLDGRPRCELARGRRLSDPHG